MKDLIFATKNKYKSKELKEILSLYDYNVLDLNDLGYDIEIEESGNTLQENAALKANYLYKLTGQVALAEDSGLEVDVLDGRPGVFSARFAGDHRSDADNIQKLLTDMVSFKNRSSQFRTVIAIATGEETLYFEGCIKGAIGVVPAGQHGFGYDPVFIPEGYDKTFAEMPDKLKNEISHRSLAVNKLVVYLTKKIHLQ